MLEKKVDKTNINNEDDEDNQQFALALIKNQLDMCNKHVKDLGEKFWEFMD